MIRTNRLPWIAAATALAAAVLAMFGIGWLLAPGEGGADAARSSQPVPSGAPTSGPTAPPSGAPLNQDDSQSGGSGQAGSGDGDGDASEPGGPRIDVFRVAQEPSCPGGTTQFPVEGTPVTLEWEVAGGEEITLSVDGPGVYATYPAEGSATIDFGCAGQEGDTQEHIYLLTAVGDGVTRTATLVVTATVHEVADVPSDG